MRSITKTSLQAVQMWVVWSHLCNFSSSHLVWEILAFSLCTSCVALIILHVLHPFAGVQLISEQELVFVFSFCFATIPLSGWQCTTHLNSVRQCFDHHLPHGNLPGQYTSVWSSLMVPHGNIHFQCSCILSIICPMETYQVSIPW